MAAKKVQSSRGDQSTYKAQADKGWEKFAAWINGKDVRGGPEAQKRAAKMRADRIRAQMGPKGGQTRRAPAKNLPPTK